MVFGTNKDDIDNGNAYDWGKASQDYAKYRDIYPKEFFDKIEALGIGQKGQKILDLGTGTGVLPRAMYDCGAEFTATDISQNQIDMAKKLSEGKAITYLCKSAEELDFDDNTFDACTAMTCFFYFDHAKTMPILKRLLKPQGKICIGYMAWLPFEDELANKSEQLILKYNPKWTGHSFKSSPVEIPKEYLTDFKVVSNEVTICDIPFTKESWTGRMKACRGIGASLFPEKISCFENELLNMLDKNTDENFTIKHSYAIAVLEKL